MIRRRAWRASRIWATGAAIALATSAAGAWMSACSAGPIDYSAPDGQAAIIDAGGAADVVQIFVDGGVLPDSSLPPTLPSSSALPCNSPDADVCDLAAGFACCFRDGGDPGGECVDMGSALTTANDCNAAASVIVACSADTADSDCCWGATSTGAFLTRYADCKNQPHACPLEVPDPDGGALVPGSCADGTACKKASCSDTVGYCGGVPPC